MIASITGQLRHVGEDRIHLQAGAIVYELLVPASDLPLLQAELEQEMSFFTMLYIQGDANGSTLEPRLIGFLRRDDKRFFEKFITVKGIGPRKALKALALPAGEIAGAIEARDVRFLCQLPEIGRRTAEQIVAELAGKVKDFVAGATEAKAPVIGGLRRSGPEEDAIAALMALGERRSDAEHLLDRVMSAVPGLRTTDELLREMLRIRTVRL